MWPSWNQVHDYFLTREYAKYNWSERVIGDNDQFAHSLSPSLRCKLYSHIYVEITVLPRTDFFSSFFFELEIIFLHFLFAFVESGDI